MSERNVETTPNKKRPLDRDGKILEKDTLSPSFRQALPSFTEFYDRKCDFGEKFPTPNKRRPLEAVEMERYSEQKDTLSECYRVLPSFMGLRKWSDSIWKGDRKTNTRDRAINGHTVITTSLKR